MTPYCVCDTMKIEFNEGGLSMNFDRINTITENRTMDCNENPLPIDE